MEYRSHRIPVPGGALHVAEWLPDGVRDDDIAQLPTVVAVHGLGSQHRAWQRTAGYSSNTRIIAPDLRGVAASRDLPGPWGIAARVDDLIFVCDHFGIRHALGAGHSLGAFVVLLAAVKEPDLFDGLLLIDGGYPVAARLEISEPEHLARIARERTAGFVGMRFASVEEHRAFWQAHPSVHEWDDVIQDYLDNDIVEIDGSYRWSSVPAAIEQDTRELFGSRRFTSALDAVGVPITLIAARVGLFDDDPGIYSDRQLETIEREYPAIRLVRVQDNHYMNVISRSGGRRIAEELVLLRAAAQLGESEEDSWEDAAEDA